MLFGRWREGTDSMFATLYRPKTQKYFRVVYYEICMRSKIHATTHTKNPIELLVVGEIVTHLAKHIQLQNPQ